MRRRSTVWRLAGAPHYTDQFRLWWGDDVDHHFLLNFLRARGFLTSLRVVIALVGAGMAVALLALLATDLADPAGPMRVLVTGITVVAVAWPFYWLFGPWPTPRMSITLFLFIDIGIAVAGLAHRDPLAGLTATPVFAVTGIYILFFHGARAMVAHLAIVVVAIAALAARLAVSDYPEALPLTVGKTAVALLVTVFILPFAQFAFWLIRNSSVESLFDPLTTLANRRGLRAHMSRLIGTGEQLSDLCVFVIDIDKFKNVNDRHGHAVGDDILVQTAAQVRRVLGEPALAARTGGEEFVAVDAMAADRAAEVGSLLRAAIGEVGPPGVTVSIGAACGPVHSMECFERLLHKADTAMYRAKHDGGDRVSIADPA
ncbi:diguanylate cyclase domain-containing protein [Mycolicibacterium sp. PDY-3]|uniref:GGDEF domain-containing protein n=1 Tax=Mycolicibacterium sp. PDY-3 TaxID=3376069 RepID=UPI0037BD1B69